LNQHNSGKTISTKPHRPYELVYIEECTDLTEARAREFYYKTGRGREDLKIRIMKY
jgi:putative endonuclease